MIKATAAAAILAVQVGAFSQGVLIGQGEYFDFEVSALTYRGPGDPQAMNELFLTFNNDLFDPGETISLLLSATPITDPAARGMVIPRPPSGPSYSKTGILDTSSYWPSLPAYLRVGMQFGSVELDSIFVDRTVNGSYYSDTFIVPEPSSAALSALALVLFSVIGLNRRRAKRFGSA